MSEEQLNLEGTAQESTTVDAAAAAPAPVVEKAARAPRKPAKDEGYPKFVKAAYAHSYLDPDTNVRYSPSVPVKVDVAPKEGSWLHCQMVAGLIVEA